MKFCKKCNQNLEDDKFYPSRNTKDELFSWCKVCTRLNRQKYYHLNKEKFRERRRKYLKKYYEKSELYKKKGLIGQKLKYAIQNGKIKKRNSCEICHNSPVHGHHEDYSKPLEVIWLCPRCHGVLHRQYKEKGIILS